MMRGQVEFRYFADFERWAQFSAAPCSCEGLCLEGVYFDDPDVPDEVCLKDLLSGEMRVDVPGYLKSGLTTSVMEAHPDWSLERVSSFVDKAADDLSKTPPVPWIQSNRWPIHHGDFCRYVGEWDQAKLDTESPAYDGRAYLASILKEPNPVNDLDALWHAIGLGWSAVFVFECLSCTRHMAVAQTY